MLPQERNYNSDGLKSGTPVTVLLAFRRLRQEDHYEFKTNLSFIFRTEILF